MQILIFILSAILLILIIALVFKKDFRADVIRSTDNSGEIKHFKFKGTLFWVVYAFTAAGTIYLALQHDKHSQSVCSPFLASESDSWVAIDLNKAAPVDIFYGCDTLKERKIFSTIPKLNMDLTLDEDLRVRGIESSFQFGEISEKSISKLLNCNRMSMEQYIEIYFSFDMNTLLVDTIKNQPTLYDWYEYKKLPFRIQPKILGEGMVEVSIIGKKPQLDSLEIGPLSLGNKWSKTILHDNSAYIIRLRSRDIYTNNDYSEHANFQIIKLSLKQ
ncbi:hypothetical protein [Marinilabilia salmonicolor]|uniref:hypothetical protein n=1 Tax=Marinilabilia salmonicolor TaxID=989 RepID=UPI00029AC09F|nr:hypothetical protein [Marinilabilia salmonicolor]